MLFFNKKIKLHDAEGFRNNRLNDNTPFSISEAYKTIRTNLQYVLAPMGGKTIVVSSASPGEGKSTTASNLAIALAQTSSKVLLVDADMRKPSLHRIFEVENTHGLSRFLGGFESLAEALKRDVEPNLDLITAGLIPPNPSELLGSKNTTLFLQKVQDFYDYIIIDTPPLNLVSDAVILSKKSTGIVLVAKQKRTTTKALRQAIDSIRLVRSKILGIILTEVKEKYKLYSKYGGSHERYAAKYYSSYYDTRHLRDDNKKSENEKK